MPYIKANPGPFLFKMAEHPEAERMWGIYEGFLRRSDPVAIGKFILSFYTDSDPMMEGLRQIVCPLWFFLGNSTLSLWNRAIYLRGKSPMSGCNSERDRTYDGHRRPGTDGG